MGAERSADPILDARAQLTAWGFVQGKGDFLATWAKHNPLGIPGAIYVGDDDGCGTGPEAAPNNIYVFDYAEVVFRQPANVFELRQIVIAAQTNTLSQYAFDGDDHWTESDLQPWWRSFQGQRQELRARVESFTAAVVKADRDHTPRPKPAFDVPGARRVLEFLDNDAEQYLEQYAAFLKRRG